MDFREARHPSSFLNANFRKDVSCGELVEELSNPTLTLQKERSKIHILIVNLLYKYLAEYLELDPNDLEGIYRGFKERFERDGPLAAAIHDPLHPNRYTDQFALNCLADIPATAAIFREIIFGETWAKPPKRFYSVEFGSGTGILTLASAILGRRSGLEKPQSVGYECQTQAVECSRRTLSHLLRPDEFHIEHVDLLAGRNSQKAIQQMREIMRPNPVLWIAEIVNVVTGGFRLLDRNPSGKANYKLIMDGDRESLATLGKNMSIDPFIPVLHYTLQADPQFPQKVEEGRVRMWPDPVHRRFYPDPKGNTTIVLTTDICPNRIPLHRIGHEFGMYETIGGFRRFRPMEEVKKATRVFRD